MDERRIVGLLREARQQLELERQRRSAPIAIVGIGCRFPGGVVGPESLWNLLRAGVDATSEIPADRWDVDRFYDPDPDAIGKAYVRRGGFLERIDTFDAEFFGISPREATGMDPQQRLLLEVSWEALEDGGIPPERLRGSATGVWVGLGLDDYARRSITSGDLSRIDPYSALGNTRSVAAGRIAYVLDLRGPAVQLDTSCSSSLVAVHQACQSLRLNEVDAALVGGVNLMSSPEATIALCKLRALSPDGRCKTFDAEADGYSRGEGCGMLVLKRLTDARADGNRIYAVIRGTAINHDGRSNGLTAPNGLAQEAVIRAALANAGLAPAAVDYVEAHGTGTLLGDPIEILALARVYGEGRATEQPLYVGSLKTNFGHLEGAAGVAGLIKLALCLERGQIAAHLNLRRHNPKIPWERLPIRVATEAKDWSRIGKARVGGVSSFGLSGTNAHVLLEEAPPLELSPLARTRSAELIVLSAKTPRALEAAAGNLRGYLDSHPQVALGDLAYSLLTTRSAMGQRLALSVPTRQALMEALHAAERGETPAAGARGQAGERRGKLAWLFTGQGAQQLGMGRSLHGEWPVFRDALEEALSIIDPLLDRPLRQIMWAAPQTADAALLDQTGYTQPALFAFEWALAQLWRSFGVEPDILMGHSIGELTAACVAGVFSLPDAARLVCARARLMQSLPAGGAMVSIAADEPTVAAAIADDVATVSVAAVNGPASIVIAGVEADVLRIAERFTALGVQTKRLVVSHAFHSPLMEPMLGLFGDVAESISYQLPRLPLVSNVTGVIGDADVATAGYWVRHVREAVRFSAGVRALHAAGARAFLELGPRATLLGLVPASVPDEVVLLASLRAGRAEARAVLDALAGYFSRGGSLNEHGLFPSGGRRLNLPTYAWHRERYWIDAAPQHTDDVQQRTSPTASWFHSVAWRQISVQPSGGALGAWAVIGPEDKTREILLELRRLGGQALSVPSVKQIAALIATGTQLRGVIHAVDTGTPPELQVLELERVLSSASGSPPKAWWLTHGAVSVGPDDAPEHPEHAAAWGLGRSIALEHPRTWGGLIDLPARIDEAVAKIVVSALSAEVVEDQLAVRQGDVFASRLVAAQPGPESGSRLSGSGTALVTGGLGALGLHLAKWLAAQGLKNILLIGRRGAVTEASERALKELKALGVSVTVAAADVADRSAMKRALGAIAPDAPLTSVFHAAGINDVTALEELSAARLAEVLRPKREGTLILDELTRDQPLEAFVCFSSIAGVWGAGRQAAYAAANAFLDAWAQRARRLGRPAFSISWGPWSGAGMADDRWLAELARRGLRAMSPERALKTLGLALDGGDVHTVIADVDWAILSQALEVWGPRPMIAELRRTEQATPATSGARNAAEQILGLPPEQREAALVVMVRSELARVLSFSSVEQVPLQRPIHELGLDSLMALELRSALGRRLGVKLSATFALDQPTPEAITKYMLALLLKSESVAPVGAGSANVQGAAARTLATPSPARCERLRAVDSPAARVFCFHDAAGSPELFTPFGELGADIEIHTVSQDRRSTASEASARQYLAEVVRYITAISERPYILFGHSLGALFAWRVAQELSSEPCPQPLLLVASAPPPYALTRAMDENNVGEAFKLVFGESCRAMTNVERDFASDSLMWHFMPAHPARALPLAIDSFIGREDHLVNEASAQEWRHWTTESFSLTVLPGDHFYLSQSEPRNVLFAALRESIRARLAKSGSPLR